MIFSNSTFSPTLGPNIVICDEGHVLKNDATGLAKSMNLVKTGRRIVLTGTPLQNNLIECKHHDCHVFIYSLRVVMSAFRRVGNGFARILDQPASPAMSVMCVTRVTRVLGS